MRQHHDEPTGTSALRMRTLETDARRQHWVWRFLDEGRAQFLAGLAELVAEWRDVPLRHELELATFMTEFARRLDTLLGEHEYQVWYTLLELRDATPRWRTPPLERALSPAAHPQIAAALLALTEADAAGPAAAWHAGAADVVETLAGITEALRSVALGRPVADLLASPRCGHAREEGDLPQQCRPLRRVDGPE